MKILLLKLLLLLFVVTVCKCTSESLEEGKEPSDKLNDMDMNTEDKLTVDDNIIFEDAEEVPKNTSTEAANDGDSPPEHDFARGKQPNFGDDEGGKKLSESSYGLGYIPLGLLALVVIIPLLLLPILFLFTRRSGFEDLDNDEDTPDLLQVLNVDYSLLPITHPDPFLGDPAVWSDVVMVKQTGEQQQQEQPQPFYRLTPENAFVRLRTGQLYHPLSGLLFNPVPGCDFHVATGRLSFESSGSGHLPNSAGQLPAHLVYEEDTHYVYEPTLSLASDGTHWHLAAAPTISEEGVAPFRRVAADELPGTLQAIYQQLLAASFGEEAAAVGPASSPSSSLSEDAPKLQPNPLIISKVDFSQEQPADLMTTPRGSIASMLARVGVVQQQQQQPKQQKKVVKKVKKNPLVVSEVDFSKPQPADTMPTPRGSVASVLAPVGQVPKEKENPLIVSKVDFSRPQPSDTMTTPRGSVASILVPKVQTNDPLKKSTFKKAAAQQV